MKWAMKDESAKRRARERNHGTSGERQAASWSDGECGLAGVTATVLVVQGMSMTSRVDLPVDLREITGWTTS